MTTLAILLVLLMFALPSFTEMTRSQTVGALNTDLLEGLIAARAEAVKTQRPVAVEQKTGGWIKGWTVYVDANNNNVFDGGDTQIRDQTITVVDYKMQLATGAGAAITRLAFDRRGGITIGAVNGVFCAPGWTAAKDQQYGRSVRMLANGIADTSRGSTGMAGLSCP